MSGDDYTGLPLGYSDSLLPNNHNVQSYKYNTIKQALWSKFGVTNYLLGIKLNFSINLALYYAICGHVTDYITVFDSELSVPEHSMFGMPVVYDLLITSCAIIIGGQILGSLPLWTTVKIGKTPPVNIQSIKHNTLYKLIFPIYWPNSTHYIAHLLRTILLTIVLVLPIWGITALSLFGMCTYTNSDTIQHINDTCTIDTCYMSSTQYTMLRAIYCGIFASLTGPICYVANLCSTTIPLWALNGYHRAQDKLKFVIDSDDTV